METSQLFSGNVIFIVDQCISVPKRNTTEPSSLIPTRRSNGKGKSQEIRRHSERMSSVALAKWPRDRPARVSDALSSEGHWHGDRVSAAFIAWISKTPARRSAAFFTKWIGNTPAGRSAAFCVGDTCWRKDIFSSGMYHKSRKHGTWRVPCGTDAATQKHAHASNSQIH